MHGQGTLEDSRTGIKYTGTFANGKITGFGKYTFLDGSEYEGGFLDGKFEGDGTFTLLVLPDLVRTRLFISAPSKTT